MKILIPQRGEGQDTGRRFVLLHRDVSHHEDENRKVKISFTFFLFSCFRMRHRGMCRIMSMRTGK